MTSLELDIAKKAMSIERGEFNAGRDGCGEWHYNYTETAVDIAIAELNRTAKLMGFEPPSVDRAAILVFARNIKL